MGLLILGRKIGERVRIGNDIYVTVLEASNPKGQIKLGFEAPDDINIVREELIKKKESINANRNTISNR